MLALVGNPKIGFLASRLICTLTDLNTDFCNWNAVNVFLLLVPVLRNFQTFFGTDISVFFFCSLILVFGIQYKNFCFGIQYL